VVGGHLKKAKYVCVESRAETVLRFFAQNVERKYVKGQNVKQQNVERQNVEQQNVEQKKCQRTKC
jgi:hypothetical protein